MTYPGYFQASASAGCLDKSEIETHAGMGGALQSVSKKQDAMSEVAGQVLDQAQGLATRVAGISSDLTTLQQAGVSNPNSCWRE